MFGIVGGVIKGAVTGDWSTLRNMGTAFVTSAILSWGNPYAIAASVLAAGFMDTPPGQQFSRFMVNDVFDDAFGMRPRAAYIVGNMAAYAIVTSSIYIGLTTIAPQPSSGIDYTNPANRNEISQYASDVSSGPGGSSANWIGKQVEEGTNPTARTAWYIQGRVSSEVAFQDTPVLGKTLNALQVRHSAAVVNVGGKLVDSAKNISLIAPLKGQIFATPWTGVCHQATVRTLIQGGMTGMQAVQATASQVGWSFYFSSSIYGIEGHAGAVGIVNAEVNRKR